MPLKYLNRNNNSSVISVGNSVLFNGSGQYLTATRTGGWLNSANNFTLECWVYFTRNPSTYGGYYGSHIAGTTVGSSGWELGFSSDGVSTTSLSINFKDRGGFGVTRTFNTNTWYHIAIVRSGTNVSMYIDGTLGTNGTVASWPDNNTLHIGALNYNPYFYYFPGYISNFRIVAGTAVYTSNFTPSTTPLTAIANTSILTCNAATIVDSSSNNFAITNNGGATVSSVVPVLFTAINIPSGVRFLNRSNIPILLPGTQKAIFGYGRANDINLSITNLVSNTGVVATDTTGVGTGRNSLAAAGYGSDKAIFGYGYTSTPVSITNLVSNTGVVSTDTIGVGTARNQLAAAGYGSDKAIFGYGFQSGVGAVSMTNLVSNTGIVSTDTAGVGTGRYYLAAAGYGGDKAIFGYGVGSQYSSMTNLVSNTGVVSTDTTGVGTVRAYLAAAGYGSDKAIFGYGYSQFVNVTSITNLVSNTGVVSTDTTGVGTARYLLAAAGYGSDKAIFGYGNGGGEQSITNLVSNTGVVSTDTTGVGTARTYLAAAGYSVSYAPTTSNFKVKKIYADPLNFVTNGLVLYFDASNASSYPGSGTTWTNLSGAGNNGTLVNGVGYNSANGGSLVFDGSNDYIDIGISTSSGARTFSIWLKSTQTGDAVFFSFGNYDWSNSIGIMNYGNNLTLFGSNTSVNLFDSQSLIRTGNWVNVVITQSDSTNATIISYINGSVGTQRTGTTGIAYSGTTNYIGRRFDNAVYFSGNIAQTLIYNRALSASEVLQNYNVTKTRFGL